jgi:hypothetical protein
MKRKMALDRGRECYMSAPLLLSLPKENKTRLRLLIMPITLDFL